MAAHPAEYAVVEIRPHHHRENRWRKADIGADIASAVTASRQVLAGDVRELGGWALAETTGAAGVNVRLRDGGAGGEVLAPIHLAAGESTRDIFPIWGIDCHTGRIYLELVGAGSVEGVVYWR